MKPDFTCILQDIPGAEGPVYDLQGNFYMVAPNNTVSGDAPASGGRSR